MRLLNEACAERIVGGGLTLNLTTSVSNSVAPTTVKPKVDISNKPNVIAKANVGNQSNLTIGVIASGAVNSSFLASQIVSQVNGQSV